MRSRCYVVKREEGRKPGQAAQGKPATLKTESCILYPWGWGKVPLKTLNPHYASESPAKPLQGNTYLTLT